jgi:hypothetical protein
VGEDVSLVSTASFPQVADNRTRKALIAEIAEYIGGESNADDLTRAGRSLDEAVRTFNERCWRFNRLQQSITLVASTSSYTLNDDCRAPMRAVVVDGNGADIVTIPYIPYQQVLDYYPQTVSVSGSRPAWYTVRNLHEVGQVTYYPPLGAALSYPTVRHEYFRRIALTVGDDDQLQAPSEVEQAIFEWAVWRFILKTNIKAGPQFQAGAQRARQAAEREWGDFPDVPAIGVRG